jgi:hypothetical protein
MVCASRRRPREETTVQSLDDLGWDSFFDQQVTDDERARWTPARVVWEGRERFRLSTGDAEWLAALSGRLRHVAASGADLPAIGDWVLAGQRPAAGTATIHRVLSRRSRFSRAAAGRSTEEQVAAALEHGKWPRACVRGHRSVGPQLPLPRLLARRRTRLRGHSGDRARRARGRTARQLSASSARRSVSAIASG